MLLPDGFVWGLALGGVLAVTAGVIVRKHPAMRPFPVAGLAAASAGVVAIEIVEGLPAVVWLGVALAAIGGELARRLPAAAGPVVAVPGAWLATSGLELRDDEWIRPVTLITTVLVAPLIADLDRARSRHGLGPVLLAVSVAGIYTTIPDTEEIIVLVGVMIPIALLGWPRPCARLGDAGAFAIVTLLGVVVGHGGQGRPPSVIAGLACLAVLGLEPVMARLGPSGRRRRGFSWGHSSTLFVIHLVLVVVLARLVGAREQGAATTATIALALAAAGAVLVGLSGRRERIDYSE